MVQIKYSGQKESQRDLIALHGTLRSQIIERLGEFRNVWESGSEEDIFHELVFCLLTPQSKARSCHSAVCHLIEEGLMDTGSKTLIARALSGKTRFHNTKAENIVLARKRLTKSGKMAIKQTIMEMENPMEMREWLVNNIRGLGYKEASHFLRNIGFGEDMAILDRHILKNLTLLAVLKESPASMTRKRYLEIEEKMRQFSENIKIPMDHLDLLLWYKETREIFK